MARSTNVQVTKSGVRHVTLALPDGQKIRYDVALDLPQAELVARAQAWLDRNHAGTALEACRLYWNPEFPNQGGA